MLDNLLQNVGDLIGVLLLFSFIDNLSNIFCLSYGDSIINIVKHVTVNSVIINIATYIIVIDIDIFNSNNTNTGSFGTPQPTFVDIKIDDNKFLFSKYHLKTLFLL